MPHIIVIADGETGHVDGAVMLRERITVADLECDSFGTRLLERLNWAVEDADEVERGPANRGQPSASVVTTAS